MTTAEELRQLQADFDRKVKERLLRGEPPESAVFEAAREVGIVLPPAAAQAVIRMLREMVHQQQDPEFRRKQAALAARIRELCKDGLSIRQAVRQAQDDVGIHLGERGAKILTETLEQESERMAEVRLDVVPDAEYERMTGERLKPH